MGYLPSDGFRKGKYARAGCPFGEMAAGRGWVRSAHFALAGWKNPPNSLNGVFPRILILLRGVRCLFRVPEDQKLLLDKNGLSDHRTDATRTCKSGKSND